MQKRVGLKWDAAKVPAGVCLSVGSVSYDVLRE